jgi:hypothetical protein
MSVIANWSTVAIGGGESLSFEESKSIVSHPWDLQITSHRRSDQSDSHIT